MPDDYHFEVSVDSSSKRYADATVRFHDKTLLQVDQQDAETKPVYAPTEKKHWWQIWKRGEGKSVSKDQ